IVVTHAAAPADRRDPLAEVADVLVCGAASVDVREMVDALAEAGLPQVLCEGGPHLFGSLIEADRVDELCLSLSPMLVAGAAGRIVRGAPEVERSMRLVHAVPAGDLLLLRYSRRR
ncbi:MAG: pyrimidine reductase family protein, partial [Agromyces sp.]|nr:pyrimidine reductase family protein [Agromyces sp.]